MIGAMRLVTIGVSDLESSLRLFRDVMAFDIEREYEASSELLIAWRLPAGTACRIAELSCAGYPEGRVRLAEFDPQASTRVRDDHQGSDSATDVGVKAIDFYVRPPMERWVALLEQAGCVPRSRPIRWEIGGFESEELNISGPDGYPILLMIGWRHPGTTMRDWDPSKPFSEVATTSVVCGDLDRTRHFYGEVLGLEKLSDDEVTDEYRSLANTLTGVPDGTRVRLTLYAGSDEPSGKLLLVHFYEASTRRLDGRMRPGNLGASMFTHATDDLDGLHGWLVEAESTVLTRPTHVPEFDGRLMLATGPNDELFEFVEAT